MYASRSKVISFTSYYRETHTEPIAGPGLLKWSVITQVVTINWDAVTYVRARTLARFCLRMFQSAAAKLVTRFALCCHSNATRASTANPPNSAQLGSSLYHAPKLHPGPSSSVGVRPRTDRQTDTHTQTRVTTIYFASSTTARKM